MFVVYEDSQRVPIKIWLENHDDIEDMCMLQAINLSKLPFAYKHIALMPDTHMGVGMPIGGVLATTPDVIVPNAVGVDIGCGMSFIRTNIPAKLIKEIIVLKEKTLAQEIVENIMNVIPVGFSHHKEKQKSLFLDNFKLNNFSTFYHFGYNNLPELNEAYYQIGTLGGGNHFIELQEDEEGFLGIMIHSGSRNFGYKIANYFNKLAIDLNQKWYSKVSKDVNLAFLHTDTDEGKGYIDWMNLALNFAKANRELMMERTIEILIQSIQKYTNFKDINFTMEVNIHHNYAAMENHFNKNVWIHRKGATRARKDELGIIPGAMGSFSYIVSGLGNTESFMSCSHGAGRVMGRREAMRNFTVNEVKKDLLKQGVIAFGKANKDDSPEEYRKAYKNIDEVMNNQKDLVKPILKLKTVAVIKG